MRVHEKHINIKKLMLGRIHVFSKRVQTSEIKMTKNVLERPMFPSGGMLVFGLSSKWQGICYWTIKSHRDSESRTAARTSLSHCFVMVRCRISSLKAWALLGIFWTMQNLKVSCGRVCNDRYGLLPNDAVCFINDGWLFFNARWNGAESKRGYQCA